MKKTYFLDKIHNANIREFESIMDTIVLNLEQENFPYSYCKKDGKWLIEIEKEEFLISVIFDDFTMRVINSAPKKELDFSNNWQKIFYKFLHKNQKYYYKKSLQELEEKKEIKV